MRLVFSVVCAVLLFASLLWGMVPQYMAYKARMAAAGTVSTNVEWRIWAGDMCVDYYYLAVPLVIFVFYCAFGGFSETHERESD